MVPPKIDIAAAVAALRDGKIIAYPTETFYGLGADPLHPDALRTLLALKGGRESKAMPLLLPDAGFVDRMIKTNPSAKKLMARFWPGPLTLVAPAIDPTHPCAAADGTLGVRVSAHPVAHALLRAWGAPLTTTSANRGGEAPARTAAEVAAYFGEAVLIVDGGKSGGEMPSTVVRLGDRGVEFRILRPGRIGEMEIAAVLG